MDERFSTSAFSVTCLKTTIFGASKCLLGDIYLSFLYSQEKIYFPHKTLCMNIVYSDVDL
jgi:hypothetical protein